MPQICVPKEFFVKERRMYSNWMFAFWREFFQNSVDAGARNIEICSSSEEDRSGQITFTDDGCGMSREVLERVYFRLGATSKNDGDFVGGFGRARILTCFSMRNYQIRTLDNLVVGDGGEYNISPCEPFAGTEIKVEFEDEDYYQLMGELNQYLHLSQLPCSVVNNGVRFADWNHRRQATRVLERDNEEFATVYVNKSSKYKNLLIVRVSGAVMFYQYLNAPAQVIVEVNPRVSRKVLTANRDGFQSGYARILDAFTQELAVETTSALQPKFKRKTATIRGTGLFVSYAKRVEEVAGSAPAVASADESVGAKKTFGISEILGHNPPTTPSSFEKVEIRTSERHGGSFLPRLPDIFIVDDTTNANIRKVIDQYHPENWVTLYRGNKTVNKGSTIYKVLMTWKIACQYAIDSMLAAYPKTNAISWGIGWVFSDTAEAMCKKIDAGHALLLNPVDADGDLKFLLRSQVSQKKLMAYAKHEVAHVLENYHNETFARILTSIDEHYDEREVYKAIREYVY